VETILNQAFSRHIHGGPVVWLTIGFALLGLLFYLPRIGMLIETAILFLVLAAMVVISHQLFIRNLVWLDIAPLLGVFTLQFVAGVTIQRSFGRKKNAMITSMFGKYVSAGVVNELIGGDISTTLEGSRQKLTMLFSDLRDFTSISERLGAKDTGRLLNVYFDAMIPLVFENQGTLDKLMGDAVMAFFGAPMPVPDHPARAAAAALQMMEKLQKLKLRTDVAGTEDLDVGIGLNTGEVTVGNLGSNAFMDYTIIGDAVNLASRLEGLNKVYGTHIICSEFMANELDERFLIRELDKVKVKGKEKVVRIYELVGWRERFSETQRNMFYLFEKGLILYREREWGQAEQLFKHLLVSIPDDGPTSLYLNRIANLRHDPPPVGWQGVTSFDHK
jgi:adenylate cyclase